MVCHVTIQTLFFPSYTLFDLLKNNPFKVLGDQVKELISYCSIEGSVDQA